MKNKEKYDLKKLYVDVDHDLSNGGVEIECAMRYGNSDDHVWEKTFTIEPEDVLFRSSWIDTHELMIESVLEWLEEESK